MTSFSLIIPSYNQCGDLLDCLDSVINLNYKKELYEIIVVEDGSTDKTRNGLSRLKTPNLKIIKISNDGAAHARNLGIEKSTKDVLVFLDQDVILDKNLLVVYNQLFSKKNVDVVQGNVWAQVSNTKIAKIHSLWRHRVFLEKSSVGRGKINTIITRNTAIKKRVLMDVKDKYGYIFDESFHKTGGEDRELGHRIYKQGCEIVLEPSAVVWHRDPENWWKIMLQKYRHARGDVKFGIGEHFFDINNFKRTVLSPARDNVPVYFSLTLWAAHILGATVERLNQLILLIRIRLFYAFKRILDVVGSLVGIILGFPVFLVIAISIKKGSPGPVIFKQKRLGLHRKEFEMFKFRTMVVDAEKILQCNPKLLEIYRKNSYKIKDDPRVTKIGKLLRKFSLDELPQLFNILIGQMSIVGPRAYKKDEITNQLELHPALKKHAEYVTNTKPGLTGVWQITGRSEIGFENRILLDYEYAVKRSISYDLGIILKTIPVVLKSKGAW